MSSSPPHIDEEWLRLLYEEAWRQYDHEVNLGQSRGTLFLTTQTALLGFVGFLIQPLLGLSPLAWGANCFSIGLFTLGILTSIIGTLSFVVAYVWNNVIEANRLYLNLRWLTIIKIERKAQLNQISLGHIEWQWRNFGKANGKQRFYPFYDEDEDPILTPKLSTLYLDSLPKIRGWSALKYLANTTLVLSIIILLLGFFTFFMSFIIIPNKC